MEQMYIRPKDVAVSCKFDAEALNGKRLLTKKGKIAIPCNVAAAKLGDKVGIQISNGACSKFLTQEEAARLDKSEIDGVDFVVIL